MKRLLFGFALALAASAASAQAYIGGQIGQAKAASVCDGNFAGSGVSCDDSSTAWKVLGGYQFNKHFAAEVGWQDFGKVASASGPGGTASAKAWAADLVGVGTLPVGERFGVYGKLGVYYGNVDARVNTTTLVANESESNTGLTFGFGARFDVTPKVALRAEWQRYGDLGGGNIGKDDVDVISLGVLYRF